MTESVQIKTSSEASRSTPYTAEKIVSEVAATMAMEGIHLSDQELEILQMCANGNISGDELRKEIIKEITSK